MSEANDLGLQTNQLLNRAPILRRINTEGRRWLAQARLAGNEVDIGEHIPRNQHPVRFTEKHDVASGVARRVNDAKAAYLVAIV